MASSNLQCPYSQSAHTIFFSIFMQQNRYILKSVVPFLSLSDWWLTCEWIVYKMDAVSSFQLTGFCSLLFISFVCCDLKCRIYFPPVLFIFFLVNEKIHRMFWFTSNYWDVLQAHCECPLSCPLRASDLKNVKESSVQVEKFFFSSLYWSLKHRNLFPGSGKSCHWNLFKVKWEQD